MRIVITIVHDDGTIYHTGAKVPGLTEYLETVDDTGLSKLIGPMQGAFNGGLRAIGLGPVGWADSAEIGEEEE